MRGIEIWADYRGILENNPDPQSAKRVDFREANSQAVKASENKVPQLAVIIPAYNEQERIECALASINNSLLCSGIPTEVIVADNGSVDQTGEIAKDFGAIVVREPLKGVGQARQAGLEAANTTTSCVLTTDADCVVPPNWIILHWLALNQPGVVCTYGGVRYLIDETISKSTEIIFASYLVASSIFRQVKDRFVNYTPTRGPNTGFRKVEAIEAGGYRTDIDALEDFYLGIDLLKTPGGVARKVNATVLTSARRIVGYGIWNYAKTRLGFNYRHYLLHHNDQPKGYEDFR